MTVLHKRLDKPNTLRVYMDMIRRCPEDIVRQLRTNLTEQASEHRHFPTLDEEFKKRLGE